MTDEEFYDAEIAPTLLELCKKCQDRKMAFLAEVQIGEEEFGRTVSLSPGSHPLFRYLECLARCGEGQGVNIDKFMFALAKDTRGKPHSSIALSAFGVPTSPVRTPSPDTPAPSPCAGDVFGGFDDDAV